MRLPMMAQPGRTGESRSWIKVDKSAVFSASDYRIAEVCPKTILPGRRRPSDGGAICKSVNIERHWERVAQRGVDGVRRRTHKGTNVLGSRAGAAVLRNSMQEQSEGLSSVGR